MSRDDRAIIATCRLRTPTDRQTYRQTDRQTDRLMENYSRWRSIDVTRSPFLRRLLRDHAQTGSSVEDRTTLYSTIESPNNDTIERIQTKINNEISKINEWLKINKLSLNLRKSKHMIFKKTNTRHFNLTIKIDNLVIERVECFNFLGLTLDSQMTWKKLADIYNKCSRVIGTLYRIRHFIPTQILVMLYNTLILPHFNYCIMAWG